MNALNRVLISLLILAAFFVVTIGLVVPAESLTIVKSVVDSTLRTWGRIRPEFIIPLRALLILCAILVDVLLVALLIVEVRGPAKHNIRIRKVGGGQVVVTTESIAERLHYHIDQIADVVDVKAQVKPRGGGVELDLQIQTGADVNVPEKAEQVLQVAKQVVEDKMGLVLSGKPRVHIHVTPTPPLAVKSATSMPSAPPASQDKPSI